MNGYELLKYNFWFTILNTILILFFIVKYSRTRKRIYERFVKFEKKVENRFIGYLKELDDKNYRLWKAKSKAEDELKKLKQK